MLLLLGASVPVLVCNALWVSVDAGLTSGEVAVGLDGVHGAALVGIDPVESCKGKVHTYIISLDHQGINQMSLERHVHHVYFVHTVFFILILWCTELFLNFCGVRDSYSWYLPLVQSGWLSLMSRQVRAGFFLEPSGERRLSIWVFRDLIVASTS